MFLSLNRLSRTSNDIQICANQQLISASCGECCELLSNGLRSSPATIKHITHNDINVLSTSYASTASNSLRIPVVWSRNQTLLCSSVQQSLKVINNGASRYSRHHFTAAVCSNKQTKNMTTQQRQNLQRKPLLSGPVYSMLSQHRAQLVQTQATTTRLQNA